jgi:hypothetical protein
VIMFKREFLEKMRGTNGEKEAGGRAERNA